MPRKIVGLGYWQALHARLAVHAPNLRREARALRGTTYAVFEIGRPSFQLTAKLNTRKSLIAAELFISGKYAKAAFARLRDQEADIETIVGGPLSWEEMNHAQGCRIALYKDRVDPRDEADWPNQHAWLTHALTRLDNAFRSRVCDL